MATDIDASEQDDANHPTILADPTGQIVRSAATVRSNSAAVVVQCTDVCTIAWSSRASGRLAVCRFLCCLVATDGRLTAQMIDLGVEGRPRAEATTRNG
jgi:hypothetical protein